MRATYNEYMNVHITSVAVVTQAFSPLLHRPSAPKVITVTSGLGSITNVLSPRRMARAPPYGASKVGMNGLAAHLQVGENERAAAGEDAKPRIRFFISNPGRLKTAFSNYIAWGKEPQAGAESIVQLMGDEEGKMRVVPW
ncbi:hypothetical protein MAP00_004165 [Monascus purpureus]|nr:hypothetical protein MAP00_004165 [Monascus purpureus]